MQCVSSTCNVMEGLLHSGVPVMGTQSLGGCDRGVQKGSNATEMDGSFDPPGSCAKMTPLSGG